jgi:hypothetical protein
MTDLTVQLAAVAARRWWNRWTIVLAVGVLVLGTFLLGVQIERRYGPAETFAPTTPGANQRGAFPGGFPGGGAGPSAAPDPSSAVAATTGTVKLVDGATVYVQTADGSTVTVRTSGETAVRLAGSLSGLKAGDIVSVEGDGAGTDTVTATTITQQRR